MYSLAVADAAGSAVIYAGKTVINTVDAISPDVVNKKKGVKLLPKEALIYSPKAFP